jgi:hypothetical protein
MKKMEKEKGSKNFFTIKWMSVFKHFSQNLWSIQLEVSIPFTTGNFDIVILNYVQNIYAWLF